jgi:DME family drug/metabolite transporter
VTSTAEDALAARRRVFWGTVCGLLSAVGYTGANAFLREASMVSDPVWVSCVKAAPTTLLFGPYLLWQWMTGTPPWTSRRAAIGLAIAGLLGQVLGNVSFQFALGVIGMALSVPLCLGTLLFGTALLARLWLNEPVTMRSAVAMLVLLGAVGILSFGAGEAHRAVELTQKIHHDAWTVGLAVAAACLSGFTYALLGAVIRRTVRGHATLAATLVVVSVVGLASLTPLSLMRVGLSGMLDTTWIEFQPMLMAGLFNAAAFYALSKSLQMLPVLQYNLLNASQTALAALAGVFFFGEPFTVALQLGVALTIAGLVLMQGRPRRTVAIIAEDAAAPLAPENAVDDAPCETLA